MRSRSERPCSITTPGFPTTAIVHRGLPDPCVIIDGAGRVVAANRLWNELPRRKEATEAASNPVGLDYLAIYQSSTADQGSRTALLGIRSALGGYSDHFEHEYLRSIPLAFRWFRMMVHAWGLPGTCVIIFHRDISAEKLGRTNSEILAREFRSLADSAPVLIWTSGPDKGRTFFNRQWLKFTGVPMEEQLGEGWLRLVHPHDCAGVLSNYHSAFDEKRELEFEYRLRYNDGGYRWIRDRGLPRFDSQNQLSGFIGSAWDLSDQKQATQLASTATRYARLVRDMAAVANSNVKERVRLLNGKLIVRTSPGRGTEVAVQVPVPARAH